MAAASTFQRVLGDSFENLPHALQRVHDIRSKQLHGRGAVERGTHWLVKWLALIVSLPPTACNAPLSVRIDVKADGETWTRDFDGHCMRSHLWAQGSLLAERLGLVTLLFTLHGEQERIEWRVAGARFLGVPLPASWFSGARATEQLLADRYSFDVRATLPGVGLLIHYHGWLAE